MFCKGWYSKDWYFIFIFPISCLPTKFVESVVFNLQSSLSPQHDHDQISQFGSFSLDFRFTAGISLSYLPFAAVPLKRTISVGASIFFVSIVIIVSLHLASASITPRDLPSATFCLHVTWFLSGIWYSSLLLFYFKSPQEFPLNVGIPQCSLLDLFPIPHCLHRGPIWPWPECLDPPLLQTLNTFSWKFLWQKS